MILAPAAAVLMIEIDGIQTGQPHGLWIVSSFNVVRGLAINNFQRAGIRLQGNQDATNQNLIFYNFRH